MGVNINFKQLLKPYEQGGTQNSPVKRSIETIVNALIYKYKFPPDIAGAAILKVFYKMAAEGLEFKGDGSYGSKGSELFSCIKAQAVDIATEHGVQQVKDQIANKAICFNMDCPKRTRDLKKIDRMERIKRFLLKPRGWWKF